MHTCRDASPAAGGGGGGIVRLYASEAIARGRRDWNNELIALPGDWDIDLQLSACIPKRHLAVAHEWAPDVVPVAVSHSGKLVLAIADRLEPLGPGGQTRIYIVGRHPRWIVFRETLRAYVERGEHICGCSYSPLTHPDLGGIPAWVDEGRYAAIARHISPGAPVIDLGAHLGYMCECLENDGHRCLAVERDRHFHYLLSRLREAQDYKYRSVCGDVTEVVRTEGGRWHTALALALFHHFVKTKEGHIALEELLSNLRAAEIFFWSHNPAEKQMRDAYRNYQPDEFADFVRCGAGLRHAEPIGVFRDRALFHIRR